MIHTEIFMNNHIFREYDIRGIADTDLTTETVFLIGKAFGSYLIQHNHYSLSISGDVRKTTVMIKDAFIDGAISNGIDVTDFGTLPTPVNYFSLYNTKIINSVQVTGSHNPSEYNGLKISFNKKPFYGEDIKKMCEGESSIKLLDYVDENEKTWLFLNAYKEICKDLQKK